MSTVTGQILMTEPQRTYLRDNRFNKTTGKYISTNFGGNGFFGDVNTVVNGAETFLNQEQSTGYADQWTFASTDSPITISNSTANEDSSPLGKNSVTGSYGIDNIHYAALVAYIWKDDPNSITFSGETKARSEHAFDLAEAVFNVLVEQSNDPKLDFTNTSKYPIDIGGDGYFGSLADIGAPLMYYIAKMEKYAHTYSLVAPILDGEVFFEAEWAGVEQWLKDAGEWSYQKIRWNNDRYLATEDPTVTPYGNRGFDQQHPSFSWLYYTSGNVGQVSINNVAQGVVNNIATDFVQMFHTIGLLFNNSTYRNYAFAMFELWMKLGVFPDNTGFEFSRTTSSGDALSFNYAVKLPLKWALGAYKHAVAVENGLAGATNAGLFFDYSTSEGDQELYTSGWSTQTTSGGPKSLKGVILNLGDHYRTAANGGYSDVRFAAGGGSMNANTRPFVLSAAVANTYFNDSDLKNMYEQTVAVGYNGPRYYQDGGSPTVFTDGPYNQWTLGSLWGRGGVMLAGFGLVGDMENRVFSVTSPPSQNITQGNYRLYKGQNVYYKGRLVSI